MSEQSFLDGMNWFLLAVFAIDLAVEMTIVRSVGYLKRDWPTVVVALAQVPTVIPGSYAVAGFFRLFRLVPRLGSGFARVAQLRKVRRDIALHPLVATFSLATLTWLSSATAFAIAEDLGRENLGSFLDALWWSASTITTVGYGDITPETAAGKVVAMVTMVVGIATFAGVTGTFAAFLSRERRAQESSPGH
jgi:voltage-gated potassium channel